jgi:hypothetical protein
MPMGVRTRVIQFTSSLVSQVQQPVLAQVSVHEPIQRLVSFSGNSPRTALAEYQLLNTLVLKFKRDPLNAEFFLVRKDKNQVFIVMEALVKLAHSKDSLVSIKALECIELCCSLQDPAVAKAVAKHSQLLDFITNRLQLHYKVIPTGVTPRNVLQCHASWGIDYPVHLFDSKSPPESHYLPGMFSWMDYCNILATKAHPVLGEELCTSIERQFLSTCVMADLVDSTEDCILKSLFILAKGLQHIQSKQMQNMFARFLLGSPSEKNHKLQQALVSYVDHISEEVSYAALHLFDSILRLPNVSVVGALLGLGGEGCTYPQGTGRQPRSWIQERETLEELVSLYFQIPPKWLATSYQVHGSYCHDKYLQESYVLLAHYSEVLAHWERVKNSDLEKYQKSVLDCPFVATIVRKVERMLDQAYENNLILSSVWLRFLSVVPMSLEEPLLSASMKDKVSVSTTKSSLFSALQKVCKELETHSNNSFTLKLNVIEARRRLEGKETSDLLSMPHNTLVEGAVLFEEFCKEIACLVFAKRTVTLIHSAE